jgi:hypothetical protein
MSPIISQKESPSQAHLALLMSPNDNSGLISKAKFVKPSAFMSQLERHPPLVLDFVPLASGVGFELLQ